MSNKTIRGWLARWILAISSLAVAQANAAKLYVFSTSTQKPAVIEKALVDKLGNIDVKVFSRFADFKAMIVKDKPTAIIAPGYAAQQIGDASNAIQGTIGGKTELPLFVVTLEGGALPTTKPDASIGVMDLAGRAPMKKFLELAVGSQAKIQLVTKVEDMLPLLTFKSADAVLVTKQELDELTKRTQSKLISAPIEKAQQKATLLMVLNPSTEAEKLIKDIQSLGKKELDLLGVDSWKK